MRPYGSDRIRRRDGERIVLASRLSKGWVPRAEKTLTTAQFPGTAILWEEQYFEVVDARALPQGGVEYVLEPWREHHVMRVVEAYDEPSETARQAEHRAHLARETGRKTANLLALFTGHLPAVVQNRMAEELGLLPVRLTVMSILSSYALVVAGILWMVNAKMHRATPPLALVLATAFLGVETTARFLVAWTQNRPIGSSIGLFAYIAWWLLTGRRGTSPFAVEKGFSVRIGEAPEDVAMRDLLTLREPFLTLLSPAEQQRLAERWGYDYRRHASGIAIGILVFAAMGIASSLYRGAFVALLVACAVAGEQMVRLVVLRRGPAGSMFGVLVRPFVRKLL
jgi:hypothetical protein